MSDIEFVSLYFIFPQPMFESMSTWMEWKLLYAYL